LSSFGPAKYNPKQQVHAFLIRAELGLALTN